MAKNRRHIKVLIKLECDQLACHNEVKLECDLLNCHNEVNLECDLLNCHNKVKLECDQLNCHNEVKLECDWLACNRFNWMKKDTRPNQLYTVDDIVLYFASQVRTFKRCCED